MREDFCAMILTHGRPDRVHTLRMLEEFRYTGKVFLVVDDEDTSAGEYRRLYGDMVLTFSKKEAATYTDDGDNFPGRRGVVYARNACFELARSVGCRYFIQLDDDYTGLYFRFDQEQRYGVWRAECLDEILEAFLEYFEAIPALSICFSQGGDHMGGAVYFDEVFSTRKAMNTFICDVERPFNFFGRINEDTSSYVTLGRQGGLFLTVNSVQVNQKQTQTNPGGLTELYLDAGTYVKSFYSVMYAPSCVKVRDMGETERRIHHKIDWTATAVQIVHERHRKEGAGTLAAPRPEPDQAAAEAAASMVMNPLRRSHERSARASRSGKPALTQAVTN